MTPFKKIVICGVGLIGGSFALALKKSGFKGQILGLERSPDILERAHALGIVDEVGLSLEETLRDADLIVLSVPVAQTGNVLKMILPYWHANLLFPIRAVQKPMSLPWLVTFCVKKSPNLYLRIP